ncbi:MAG: putative ABC transporter ATP-binding protein [Verrucomicrobia subdivision 3 bacterium]|nr:putative ABC transporter ATP-binding protein [Limisphaerales bacterium]MCS1417061.1 putative ABC transporter ATP-binding protein [Limisphaerales bacterium]
MKISLQEVSFGYTADHCLFMIPSLEVEAGSAVGVIGPSGAGKTSLLNLLAGILAPSSGRVVLGETVIHALSDSERRSFRNARIGMVFQDFRLLDYLSVQDNMLLPFLIGDGRTVTPATQQRMKDLMTELELTSRIKALPGQLSQGERQRVAIGRALLSSPRLILADEPTGNLDARNKGRIKELLLRCCRGEAVTLVMVTHDGGLLEGFDRVIDFASLQGRPALQ